MNFVRYAISGSLVRCSNVFYYVLSHSKLVLILHRNLMISIYVVNISSRLPPFYDTYYLFSVTNH